MSTSSRRLLYSLSICLALLAARQLQADPAAIPQVEVLIKGLGAETWQVRQEAQDALIEYGVYVQARLAQALRETRDAEVQARIEAALRQIEDNRTSGASFITMHLRSATPQQVFAELARQANAPIRPTPPELFDAKPWPLVDIDIDQLPFWAAMREICARIPVIPYSNTTDRDMLLREAASASSSVWGNGPMAQSGPFLVTARMTNTSRYLDLNQPQLVRRSGSVQLMVYAEPKLKVLLGSYNAHLDEAVDDQGNSLLPPPMQVGEGLSPVNSWVWSLNCQLLPRSATGSKIARLRGSARFIVQTRSETAEIPDVLSARNVRGSAGGRQFTLKEVRKSGQTYIVALTLFRSAAGGNDWAYGYPYQNFVLVDAEGNELARANPGAPSGGGDQVDLTLQFAPQAINGRPTGEPVKLLWEVPTETREVVVPFEFTDLMLDLAR